MRHTDDPPRPPLKVIDLYPERSPAERLEDALTWLATRAIQLAGWSFLIAIFLGLGVPPEVVFAWSLFGAMCAALGSAVVYSMRQ